MSNIKPTLKKPEEQELYDINVFNDNSTKIEDAFDAVQTALNGKTSDLTAHASRTDNPHNTTKVQVGLGNADNTSDLNKPVSNATQTALNLKANASDLTSHTGNVNNPHNTTKAQVGLGNVDNTSDLNKPVSNATQTALNLKANTTDLTSHTGNRSNPHGVTPAQVGGTANLTTVTQAEAQMGTSETVRGWSPLRVKQATHGKLDKYICAGGTFPIFSNCGHNLRDSGFSPSDIPTRGVVNFSLASTWTRNHVHNAGRWFRIGNDLYVSWIVNVSYTWQQSGTSTIATFPSQFAPSFTVRELIEVDCVYHSRHINNVYVNVQPNGVVTYSAPRIAPNQIRAHFFWRVGGCYG